MGWHEQGDGKWFLGVNIEQGRIKDYENGVRIKSALRKIVDELNLAMILTPSQSIIFRDVTPDKKAKLDKLLKTHGILPIEDVDSIVRKSMACPALPLCGLAVAEAERRMPEWNKLVSSTLHKVGLGDETMITRMTGCPNGCARPYMAELALVGDGPEMYQVWVGGSPRLTNLAQPLASKVKWQDIEKVMEALFMNWRDARKDNESFGEYCTRVGIEKLQGYHKLLTPAASSASAATSSV
jgi:sulfite reductase (ferredoxin)